MEWLVNNNIYFVRVFTKCDKLSQEKIKKQIDVYNKCMTENNWTKIPETIITSSKIKLERNFTKIQQLNTEYSSLLEGTT